jgi:hypothetical protein
MSISDKTRTDEAMCSGLVGVDLKVMRDESLTSSAKMTYIAICAHVDSDTRTASLKVSDIAREACCSRKTVQESLKALALHGVIESEPRFDGNRQAANLYRVVGCKAKCCANQPDALSLG